MVDAMGVSSHGLAFWGKAQPRDDANSSCHTLIAHALDVAAVAMLLSRDDAMMDVRIIGWLASLHDIGKFSRPFQAKSPEHWPAVTLGVLDEDNVPSGPRHDALTLFLLSDVAGDLMDRVFPPRHGHDGWLASERAHLFRAIAGHHGRPVAKPEPGPDVLDSACKAAARDFVQTMTDVFRPPTLPPPDGARAMARMEWEMAGLTTLADWVGSRQDWFPYVRETAVTDPGAYLMTRALPQAAAALAAAGLLPSRPAPFRGLNALFPGIVAPSPVQRWAEHAPLPTGPVLIVIEDLTGSGKTEAAITLVHRLMHAGLANGLFLALPTMATANAMFDRMAIAYRRLFSDHVVPSLALAHGKAALDPRFAPAFERDAASSSDAGRQPDPADETAESHCAAWLAEDRRRALLAEVGVGTIDQALLAVLPVRHATLRQRGLRGKVLVIDEAHAFDAYMQEELGALLHFHAAFGGSAIVLSATLPHTLRLRLVNAYRAGLGVEPTKLESAAYPLATLAGADGMVAEHPCAPRDGLPRTVTVTRAASEAEVLARVVDAERSGAAVAWVRNTVDDAMAAVSLLRSEGIEPLLFHARFALCDRLRVEAEVLRRFGCSATQDRAGVLVATQVVEASLDLDFDLLCTDLAPIDSLIQRAGRLWRHQRARVPAVPELVVLSPEPVDAPAPGWIADLLPGTAAVYDNPALLWRSARAIFARGTLVTPDDMRPMIEAAANGEVPDGLSKRSMHAVGAQSAAGGIARQNVLDFRRGYSPGSGAWEPDTHTPTRLEKRPQITLRLARYDLDRIAPYAPVLGAGTRDDVRRAWSMSEVSVSQRRFATSQLPAQWQAAAQAALQEWGRWERDSERIVLAVLRMAVGDCAATLEGLSMSGTAVKASYTAVDGLRWIDAS